jgi:predicted nucleotidyltransferase
MNSSEALQTLRRSEQVLRGRGIKHAALFGSVARGDNSSDSDIDILVEFDPDARITVFDYVDIKEYIAGLFDQPVDVVSREGFKPYIRAKAMADAIYAF